MKKSIFPKTNLCKRTISIIWAVFFMLLMTPSVFATNFIFSGTGEWTDAIKWSPSAPPNFIPFGDTIIIAPNADCTMDMPSVAFRMEFGTAIKVKSGAILQINAHRGFMSIEVFSCRVAHSTIKAQVISISCLFLIFLIRVSSISIQ
jgi:hypothetical protein